MLGASVAQVIVLFAKEFFVVIAIANCIAWPLGWLAVNNWLSNYAYRIKLNIIPFISVTVILATFVVVLVVIKTVQTAMATPLRA